MRIYNFSGKYINLDVVSHIKIDSKKNKIYFNMSYSILGNNNDFIQDYIYVERNAENLELLYEVINNVDFINYDEGKWVNRNTISSFKYDPTNYRIIINLAKSIYSFASNTVFYGMCFIYRFVVARRFCRC